jgi:hypothetical protein
MLDRLASTYGTDEGATFVLDNYDVIILPVFNVDGETEEGGDDDDDDDDDNADDRELGRKGRG